MQKLILQNNFLRQCKIFDYISMLFLMPAWLFDWFFFEIGFQTQKVLVLHSTSSSLLLPLFLQCWTCPRLLDIKGLVAIYAGANFLYPHNGVKALSTLTQSTPLYQSRSFNNLWYLGQTSAWFCFARGEEYM